MAETNKLKVTTDKVRFAYAKTLLVPGGDKGDEYSVCLLIPKGPDGAGTVARIKAALEALKADPKAQAKWGGKWLANFKNPLRDGDTERDTDKSPEYKNHYFVNANTYTKPGIVDAKLNPIIDPADLKSGDYGRVTIVAAPFNTDGNKGAKFYLNNVQKLASGEPLGGGAARPEDDFTAVDEDFLA